MFTERDDVRFIHDRWLNKDWEWIAIKYKGNWNVYRKASLGDVIEAGLIEDETKKYKESKK